MDSKPGEVETSLGARGGNGETGNPRKPYEPEPWTGMVTVKDGECDEDEYVAVMFGRGLMAPLIPSTTR